MNEATLVQPTTSSFDQDVLKAEGPVLVDFWAPWCGPCRALKPLVERIAAERAGKLTVAFVNVDEQPELAQRYGIVSIPALRLFKDGELVASKQGAAPKAELDAWLDANG